jgi:hypothetical protein
MSGSNRGLILIHHDNSNGPGLILPHGLSSSPPARSITILVKVEAITSAEFKMNDVGAGSTVKIQKASHLRPTISQPIRLSISWELAR